MVAGGFERVDKRFEAVDKRFEAVDKRFDHVYEDMKVLRTDIDIMLSHHIGTFRRDYDDLAARVKKIEETLFQRR